MTGATVSRHLGVLQQAGLIDSRKEGRWVYCRLAPPADTKPVVQWLESAIVESKQMQADIQSLGEIVEITREDLCRQQRGEECCPS